MSTVRDTSTKQMTIMVSVAAAIVVLGVVVLIGWLSSQAGSKSSSANPAATPIVLPKAAGDLLIDPNAQPSPTTMPLGKGQAQSVTGTYYKGSDKELLVMAVRPVSDSSSVVDELGITAVRQVGGGLCGRYTTGQDVCVVRNDNVGVVGVGLANQTLEQVVSESTVVVKAIVSQ
ncbi:hypothetical protein [Raineyella fluvialis]|uniref:Uncharacterized protein n=1 Tax=Raineyella fluvialis TaxID=2662261 RepID=A0A5Q2FC44_9ACTN|nr:hypothetical protein [Raineyella fluvialis]QGF23297.1 hypothetical protein Rai3103_06035 [Raineyella fluvialis]